MYSIQDICCRDIMIFNLLVDTEVPKEDYKFELNNYHEIDCQCFSTAFMLK